MRPPQDHCTALGVDFRKERMLQVGTSQNAPVAPAKPRWLPATCVPKAVAVVNRLDTPFKEKRH
eukprot:1762969-Amphidinium_carterae.3